mmetsp:Transcript_13042/g.30859  ORF Transcript_13042/g.30859 Transcript_13042/m.30859 type:complete len:194 (-) Transcript_13042:293-874(-)|eukprot:CAMPEP_0113625358 /NCGR_PEP_ID=MMETSP0017_2-20120614/13099_1 /TAXON_ID=2856 /ORGANISM="Cylindrotheca closterium" /LENGTH=193 /DNA_ID=CAMNT_0000535471 /DNA_START=91 /DNA_END=672 /DNA_ORIENTATION=+ /assembly_acc=CAM_ASM_000147
MKSLPLILLAIAIQNASSFAPMSSAAPRMTFCHVTPSLQATNNNYYEDEDDGDFVKVPRRRERGRIFENEKEESEFYDRVEERVYGSVDDDEEYEDDDEDEDEDDWDDEEWEDYDTFSNVVIDNPILDAIDPDGAFARFPELARDPRFWIDMILFICFLNFLSDIGPQNTLPDAIWYPNGVNIDIVGVNTPAM